MMYAKGRSDDRSGLLPYRLAYSPGPSHTVVMKYHAKGDEPHMMNDFSATAEGYAPRRSVQVPVLDRTLTTEVVGDFSLPDYQPEIKRLLRIGVNVLPPNRFAGNGGMELGGSLDYYVLYMGHDNELYCAPLSAEYRLEVNAGEEARSSLSAIGEPMVCTCDTTTETPIGRVTAPRRLNIRCKLKAEVKLYGECPLGVDTADRDEHTEMLPGEAEVARLYWGLGDALPLQDDLILPPGEGGEWRVVCAEGQILMSEAAPAQGMVNTRGDVLVKLSLCPAESAEAFASDVAEEKPASNLTILQRKIPFAQAIDMEGVTPACTATARGYCTEISVQMEEGHVHLDLGVVTEVRAQKNETIPYVKDLYSTRRESTCRYVDYPTEKAVRALNGNFTLSDSLPLSEVGMDPAARIADVTAVAIPTQLTTDPEKGRCVWSGICRCHLLLLREGEYTAADMELPFRYEFDDPALLRGDNHESNGITDVDGSMTVVTCRARMDGERVGVDAEVGVSLRTHRPAPLVALSEVIAGDTVTRRRGEYVVCFPAPTDTLWSVAKRYHAPMAALTAANNLSAGADADTAASLADVNYLIV